jgi:hypothetical protein
MVFRCVVRNPRSSENLRRLICLRMAIGEVWSPVSKNSLLSGEQGVECYPALSLACEIEIVCDLAEVG